MRRALVGTLTDLAAKDPRIMLLTADLGFSVVEIFARAFPRRFLNVGVAEANMIGIATGLAAEGMIPFVYSIATFATMRCYEQFRNGPILHRLPVRLVGIGGGFAYGHAGITHYALEDFALMRAQPGLMVVAPADPPQTQAALLATYDLPGPIYYRIGKGGNANVPGLGGRFSLNGIEVIGDGRDLLLLTTGAIAPDVAAAAEILRGEGVGVTVAVVSILNPPPVAALTRLGGFAVALSVEEHYVVGGLGSMVSEVFAEMDHAPKLRRLGIGEMPAGIVGSSQFMLERSGLTVPRIVRAAHDLLESCR